MNFLVTWDHDDSRHQQNNIYLSNYCYTTQDNKSEEEGIDRYDGGVKVCN